MDWLINCSFLPSLSSSDVSILNKSIKSQDLPPCFFLFSDTWQSQVSYKPWAVNIGNIPNCYYIDTLLHSPEESQTRVKKDQAGIGFVDGKLAFTASSISQQNSQTPVSSLTTVSKIFQFIGNTTSLEDLGAATCKLVNL